MVFIWVFNEIPFALVLFLENSCLLSTNQQPLQLPCTGFTPALRRLLKLVHRIFRDLFCLPWLIIIIDCKYLCLILRIREIALGWEVCMPHDSVVLSIKTQTGAVYCRERTSAFALSGQLGYSVFSWHILTLVTSVFRYLFSSSPHFTGNLG